MLNRRKFLKASIAAGASAVIGTNIKAENVVGKAYFSENEKMGNQGKKISGRVYNETNGEGISNVVVTNGFDVVKTDRNGKFLFPANYLARFITITTPAGYKNTTKFYIPVGSDKFEFGLKGGYKSTGKFIHITDLHPIDYDPWIDNLRQKIKGEKVDFVIATGDLRNGFEKGFYYTSRYVTEEKLGVKIYYTIGNHDLGGGEYGEQIFEKTFGPYYYSFDFGDTHFIVTPMLWGDQQPSYTLSQILKWLKKDISMQPEGKPVIMFNHENWFCKEQENAVMSDGEESLDFKTINLKAFIHGHYHQQYMAQLDNGIKIFSSSTIAMGGRHHCPSAYRKFTFDIGKNNDVQSETCFPDLKNHLVANAYIENGYIKMIASTYHAYGSVTEMLVRSGNKKLPMKQNTNFSWNAEIPITDKNIIVTACFSDGNILNCFPNVIKNLSWCSNIGSNIYFTAPLLYDGILYIASADDDKCKTSGIYAYDARTGEKLWYYHTISSVSNDIVYADGKILACDTESILYAVDAKNGHLKWQKKLRETFRGDDMFKNGICAQNGIVYAGQMSYLSAVRIADGKILWKGSNITGEPSASTHQIHNGRLHGTTSFGTRYALNLKTGKKLWQKKLNIIGGPYNYNYNSALFYKDKMYYTDLYSIHEADPATGEILRTVKTKYQFRTASAPVEKNGILYMGTADSGVIAYDLENFKELWNYKTCPSLFQTAPYQKAASAAVESNISIINDKVFFGACDGKIYCLNAETGVYIWSQNLGSPVLGDVLIHDHTLYTADYAGNLYSFDISSILN